MQGHHPATSEDHSESWGTYFHPASAWLLLVEGRCLIGAPWCGRGSPSFCSPSDKHTGRNNPLGRGHITVIGFIRMFFFLSHLFLFLDGIMAAAASRSQISCRVLPICKVNWVRASLGCELPEHCLGQGQAAHRLFFHSDGGLSFLVKYELLPTLVPSNLILEGQGSPAQKLGQGRGRGQGSDTRQA